jgi:AsmA protein
VKLNTHFINAKPTLSGFVEVESQVTLDLIQKILSLHALNINAHLKQAEEKTEIQLNSEIVVYFEKQKAEWQHIRGNVRSLPLEVLQDINGTVTLSWGGPSVDASGDLKIGALEANHIKMTDIHAPFQFKNKILEIPSMTANFYQGKLQSHVSIHFNSSLPEMNAEGKLYGVEMKPLLDDVGGEKRQTLSLSGIADLNVNLTSQGKDKNNILRHLNGNMHFSLNRGVLSGIDVGYFIDMARAFVNQKSNTTQNTGKTDFGQLTGDAVIVQGVLQNDNLLLNASQFTGKGEGKINLVNRGIDYRLQAYINKLSPDQKDTIANFYGLPIPIKITGSLDQPHVTLDMQLLTKVLTTNEVDKVKTKIQKQLQKRMDKTLNDRAGDAGMLLQNILGH